MSKMGKYVSSQTLENGVLLVKYNKPESGNSLHPILLSEMVEVMGWANNNPDVRVIVLTGEGKFFCTGMELVNGEGMSFALGSDFHELNRLFILSDKVLVAAVNGPAAGFGVTSLALCDLVYSVPDAYFFTPFVKWGMTTEACSSFTFPRLMGHQKAALLCLAAERISCEEAERYGLISKILPKDNFLQQVIDIAQKIARQAPGSLRTTKKLMREPVLKELLDANDRECGAFTDERIPSGEPEKAMKEFALEQERKRHNKSKL
jgi:peroxisomal 3,2-trans-enoyl-CoA isomerase